VKRLLIGSTALGVAATLSACSGGGAVTESLSASASAGRTAQQVVRGVAFEPLAPDAPVRPTRLRLGLIQAPVVPLSLSGGSGTLVPPSDPRVLGWWGSLAGAGRGVTLLVGHTVHTGGGELDDLEDVPVGAAARVSGVRYRVSEVVVISKAELARRASELFDQTGEARLVIVTCEGWNPATGHYSSNVVLTAVRA
jgi:hypothetical protein